VHRGLRVGGGVAVGGGCFTAYGHNIMILSFGARCRNAVRSVPDFDDRLSDSFFEPVQFTRDFCELFFQVFDFLIVRFP